MRIHETRNRIYCFFASVRDSFSCPLGRTLADAAADPVVGDADLPRLIRRVGRRFAPGKQQGDPGDNSQGCNGDPKFFHRKTHRQSTPLRTGCKPAARPLGGALALPLGRHPDRKWITPPGKDRLSAKKASMSIAIMSLSTCMTTIIIHQPAKSFWLRGEETFKLALVLKETAGSTCVIVSLQ